MEEKPEINIVFHAVTARPKEEGLMPLLIAKDKDAKVLKDDYKLGWLMRDEHEFAWVVWGSSRDYQTALKCARDCLNKQGERRVLVSDVPISKMVAMANGDYSFREIQVP